MCHKMNCKKEKLFHKSNWVYVHFILIFTVILFHFKIMLRMFYWLSSKWSSEVRRNKTVNVYVFCTNSESRGCFLHFHCEITLKQATIYNVVWTGGTFRMHTKAFNVPLWDHNVVSTVHTEPNEVMRSYINYPYIHVSTKLNQTHVNVLCPMVWIIH